MNDTQLYEQILGLAEPWFVKQVDLKMADQSVDIHVEHRPDAVFCCPVCGKAGVLYDHADERAWRHLDSCQFKTYLHARVPRVGCPEHGIHNAKLPWAETRSRFTLLMERMIIDVIRQCSTIKGTCQIMRVTWDEAFGVMQRGVIRGQERKEAAVIRHIGVDEKAFRKGHRYMTIVCDLERSTVEYVADDRKAESLAAYYAALTPAQRQGIEAVAMDMWEPYVQATLTGLPPASAKIVFDRFHIMKQMNEAVNKVRLGEHRQLSELASTRSREPSIGGYTQRRTCPKSTRRASPNSRPTPCGPRAPGRSKRRCAICGTTALRSGRPSSSTAGSAGPNARN